jgi:putative ABC transport system permease protein
MIYRLIWRNLWRNPRRTWITTASITFSVFLAVSMQSFQKGTFDNLINNVVGYYSGYIQIHQEGYWDERILDNSFENHDSISHAIQSIPGVLDIVPRIETFVLASVGTVTKGCLLVGTDPEKENALTRLKSKLIAGEYFVANEDAVVIAEGLAGRLHVSVNDTLVLFGQGFQGTMAAGKYRIKGIVKLAAPSLNDNMVYLPLSIAQYVLTAEGRITSLSLQIDDPLHMSPIQQEVRAALGGTYEVMTWEEMMPEIANHIKADSSTSYIYTGILYLIISFGFFGTILMMTAERRYEFGMLIAIGMKKIKLGWILLGETILITMLGVFFGICISLPFVMYFHRYPIRFVGETARAYEQFGFEALMPTAIHPPIFLTQSLIVMAMALVIGLYPLWHVRTIDPVQAMKY